MTVVQCNAYLALSSAKSSKMPQCTAALLFSRSPFAPTHRDCHLRLDHVDCTLELPLSTQMTSPL